jgi:NAD(P)-dependent dehydrogenase (short-subunit alcohol dehydrogenase family)
MQRGSSTLNDRHATPTNVAIVTGGSRGLGQALATALVADGWSVVIDAREGGALETARSAIERSRAHDHQRVVAVAGDIADPHHRVRLVAAAADLGGLDLVVNNASVLGPSPLPRLTEYPVDALREVFTVNVVAAVGLIQVAFPLLSEHDGAIVNITSDAAVEPYEGWGGYGASKAALEQMSRVLAAELASTHPSMRVWSVDPGDLRTQMHQDAFPGEDISDRPLPETVVPAFRRLWQERPASGRYRASDLLTVDLVSVGGAR